MEGVPSFYGGFSFHGQVTVGVFWDNKDDIIPRLGARGGAVG